MTKQETLRRYFGHDGFRPGQDPLVDALLAGHDCLGIMPTGAGKSMCYQIPALMLDGIALVISPLISLMKDQVAALKAADIPAAYLNSTLTPRQMDIALQRAAAYTYKIIYVAPERLESPAFLRFAANVKLSLIAVDEAHCISQWGQDFRPSYLRITKFIAQLPARPPVGAFTATATDKVKDDIIRSLELRSPIIQRTGFDRPNLYFSVTRPSRRQHELIALIRKVQPKGPAIVYCATRKNVESLCDDLTRIGLRATRYHAGLSESERTANQEDFQFDRADIMVATNAFGMGIDKSNVRTVIHMNMPKSMEAYYQEAGRAGRDGEPAACYLLYNGSDIFTARWMIKNTAPNEEMTPQQQALKAQQDEARLQSMIRYCTSDGCLRTAILRYFGQASEGDCGNCSACREKKQRAEIAARPTIPADAMPGVAYSAFEDGEVLLPLKKGVRLGHRDEEKDEKPVPQSDSLFEKLRLHRLAVSKAMHMPPYVVCDDKTLADMARKQPVTLSQMLMVHGMGTAKVNKFGQGFIEEILSWQKAHGGAPSTLTTRTAAKTVVTTKAKPASARKEAAASSASGLDRLLKDILTAPPAAEKEPAPAEKKAPAKIGPGKAGAKWTDAEDVQLRQEFSDGLTREEISGIHQRTVVAIDARLVKLGLISERGQPYPTRQAAPAVPSVPDEPPPFFDEELLYSEPPDYADILPPEGWEDIPPDDYHEGVPF